MASTRTSRTANTSAESPPWPQRIAWYCLLACAVLVPLVTSLGIGRLWGFYALTEEPYHTPKLLVLSLLVTVATVAWLFDVAQSRRGLRWGPAYVALGIFSALVAVSTLLSPQIATSFFGASSLFTGAYTWLLSIWTGVLVAQYVADARRLITLSRVVAATGAAVGAIALLQSLGADPLGTSLMDGFQWMIAQGMATTGNPNYTGALLVVPALVSLALAATEKDPRWRWAAVAGAAITVAALFITLTRAAWIGLAVGVIALVVLVPTDARDVRRRLLTTGYVLLGALAAGVLLIGPNMVARRFTALASGLETFSAGRFALWSDTARVVAAHPLFGSGADRLGVAAYPLQANVAFELGGSRLVLQDPHSMPLLVAAIFGVPAALAFLTLLVMTVRAGVIRLRSTTKASSASVVYAGWFAGLIGVAATSLLSVTTITLIFILFLAVGVVLAPTLKTPSERLWPTWAVGALALIVSLTGLWGTVQGNRASHALVRSRLMDSEINLKRAQQLTPWDSRIRTEYLSRKIGAMQPVLTGTDAAAARKMAEEIDTEIRLSQLDFPGELLLYRTRILMHASMEGAPGYRKEAHLEAIADALEAFPNDREFLEAQQEMAGAAE